MSRLKSHEGKRVRWMLGCTLAGVVLIAGVARYKVVQKRQFTPFTFPTPELAALDHDLQARFAVVPDKDFGIERTYGNQHYLYDPQTSGERATVASLKQQKTDAAFYLMSRALWLRSWDVLAINQFRARFI